MLRSRELSMTSFLPIAVLVLAACSPPTVQGRRDGHSWLSLPLAERQQLVIGYVAYHNAESPSAPWNGPLPSYERELSDYLRRAPQAASLELGALIELIGPRVRPNRDWRTGEVYEGKYGFYDGHYWAELGQANLRIRFVEGFILALRRDAASGQRYSQSPETYSRLVSEEFSRSGSDLDRGIGEVLSLFRDKR